MYSELKDQLISFETAKLARELGFDESCGLNYAQDGEVQTLQYWEGNGNGFESNSEIDCDFYIENNPVCSAPTQSLLQRWLREKYKIGIVLLPDLGFESKLEWGGGLVTLSKNHTGGTGPFELDKVIGTYEEALEELLQEALKRKICIQS